VNKEDVKSILYGVGLIIVIFIIPYFWRKNKKRDIDENSKYAIALIIKKTGSLKNGYHWHYQFFYNNRVYEAYRSTHIGYDVKIGDYFLVKFSYKNPSHSKILYEYQLKPGNQQYINYVWDTIPTSILVYNQKKDRL